MSVWEPTPNDVHSALPELRDPTDRRPAAVGVWPCRVMVEAGAASSARPYTPLPAFLAIPFGEWHEERWSRG